VASSPHGAIWAFTPVLDGLWRNAGAALTKCARPGNRAGLFRAHLSV